MSSPPDQYISQGQPVLVGQQGQPQQQPIQYTPSGQPVVTTAPPAGVAFYSAAQPGVVLVAGPLHRPNYHYKPSDFFSTSMTVLVLCGMLSPLSLTLSIPALVLSLQSRRSAKDGQIDCARQQGTAAAYLSFAAVIASLVVPCICYSLVVWLY